MVSAKSAWLAHYYPVEYMTATLNSYINNSDRIRIYMSKCNEKGIKVLPPHINYSEAEFSVENENIRFGLKGIKNMGGSSEQLISVREAKGNFLSYQHAALTLARHGVANKKVLESLIYCGALDDFEGTRQAKLTIMEDLLQLCRTISTTSKLNRETLITLALLQPDQYPDIQQQLSIPTPSTEEFKRRYKLEKELEYAGFYITEHPLDEYAHLLVNEGVESIAVLHESNQSNEEEFIVTETRPEQAQSNKIVLNGKQLTETGIEVVEEESLELAGDRHYEDGDYVQVAGVIKGLTVKYAPRDQKPYAIFEIEDRTGSIRVILFNRGYESNLDLLENGNVVKLSGVFKINDFGVQLQAQRLVDLESQKDAKNLDWIQVISQPDLERSRHQYKEAVALINRSPGETPIMFFNRVNGQFYQLPGGLKCTVQTLQELKWLFGEASIQFLSQQTA